MKKWLTKKTKIILCMLSAIIFALLIWTIWGNAALTVSNIKISSSRIPSAFSAFRIAQVSDLHNAEFGKGNKKLLELLSESKPDIIVITGDFVDAGHTDIDVALDFAKGAVSIAPVYYVTGNHEATKDITHNVPAVSTCACLSSAPLYCAIKTVPPIVTPIQIELIIKLIIDALLIAASPVSPTTFPTTSISTTL